MNTVQKRRVVRKIISNQRFLQLKYIAMAIDYTLDKSRKEDRYSHSIQVANAVEIMNDYISEKIGFQLDYKNVGYIIGLLHDIGHTAGGHEGERLLNRLMKEYSKDKLSFDGNANNYIVIEKENLLEGVNDSDKNYILASLAKHPKNLYEDQSYLKDIILQEVQKEAEYLKNNGHKIDSISNLKKTVQCQIMDISDENCYIVSDILDSRNVFNNFTLAKIFRDELPEKEAQKAIKALYSSKKHFEDYMQDWFFKFSENFNLINGKIVPENKDIEEIRKKFALINKKYVLKNNKVKKIRGLNSEKIERVFRALINEEVEIPSKYYKNELAKCSSFEDKLIVFRNMLGSFTDKEIKKIYKRIKNG